MTERDDTERVRDLAAEHRGEHGEPVRGRGWLLVVGIVVGAGIAIGGTLVLLAGQRARDEVSYQACRESNLPGAYIRLVLERSPNFDSRRLHLPDPDEALPILACRRTVEADHPVRLSRREEARYLEILARGRLPIVDEEGNVTGSERLPPPIRADR